MLQHATKLSQTLDVAFSLTIFVARLDGSVSHAQMISFGMMIDEVG